MQFVNAALDFDGAGGTDATQTFELPVTNGLIELPVRYVTPPSSLPTSFQHVPALSVCVPLTPHPPARPPARPRRPAKFPSVQSLTLYFPANHGEDTTRIAFLGFKGEYTPLTRNAVITTYEAVANPGKSWIRSGCGTVHATPLTARCAPHAWSAADHPKIRGLDGAQSRLG